VTLSRRRFLGLAGGAALGGGAAAWAGFGSRDDGDAALATPTTTGRVSTTSTTAPAATKDKVLVVVQMSGGNDGLNTLVPVNDGRYHDARPTLAVADTDALPIPGDGQLGLHPALAPMVPLWQAGQVAALSAIGFEDSSRSHFAALDTWWTASPDHGERTGWLGRWLDQAQPGDGDPLVAIALGSGSPALRAERTASTAIASLRAFQLFTPPIIDGEALVDSFVATATPPSDEPTQAMAQRAVTNAVSAVRTLAEALPPSATPEGPTEDVAGDGLGPITTGLSLAANLIDLELGTRIILVSAGGFDTHATQAVDHPVLLGDLATGVAGMFKALAGSGRAANVLLVTVSEFGRRVAENGSGTDHGKAGVQFVVGEAVQGGVVGGPPDLAHLADGDVRPAIDVRSLYAIALDWLGGPADDVLGGVYDRYGVLRP
jgi:uncharacterized protein (DUF1501 family)